MRPPIKFWHLYGLMAGVDILGWTFSFDKSWLWIPTEGYWGFMMVYKGCGKRKDQ